MVCCAVGAGGSEGGWEVWEVWGYGGGEKVCQCSPTALHAPPPSQEVRCILLGHPFRLFVSSFNWVANYVRCWPVDLVTQNLVLYEEPTHIMLFSLALQSLLFAFTEPQSDTLANTWNNWLLDNMKPRANLSRPWDGQHCGHPYTKYQPCVYLSYSPLPLNGLLQVSDSIM